MKKFAIAAAALALVASTITAAPASAADVAASKARVGDACATVGKIAKSRGVNDTDLVCKVATSGTWKGQTLWLYKNDPVLKELDILISAGQGGGFDTFGRSIGAAMKAEGLIDAEPTYRNITGASQTNALNSFVKNDAGKAYKSFIVGWATVGGVYTAKATAKTSDNAPIARLMGEYQVIVVKSDSKYKTLKDLVADIKKQKNKLAIAGGSKGTIDHLTAAEMYQKLGLKITDMNYVPYSGGGETATAVLSDAKVAAGIAGYGEFETFVQAGKMRILGISAPAAVAGINAKTFKSQGVNVVSVNWRGIMAPPQTSVKGRLLMIQAIDTLRATPSWKKVMKEKNWVDAYQYGFAFTDFLKNEEKKVPAQFQSVGL